MSITFNVVTDAECQGSLINQRQQLMVNVSTDTVLIAGSYMRLHVLPA